MAFFSVILYPPLHAIEGLCVFSHFFSAEQKIDSRAKLGATVAPGLQRQIGGILLRGDNERLPSLFHLFFSAARLSYRAEAVILANRATQGKQGQAPERHRQTIGRVIDPGENAEKQASQAGDYAGMSENCDCSYDIFLLVKQNRLFL